MQDLPPLRLKKHEDRRLRAGHLWIYSNEVDTAVTPLGQFEPGEPVQFLSSTGTCLGNGYVNPHSLICGRLVSRDPNYSLGRSLLRHRLNVALAMREALFAQPYYRLLYGESDGVPGLVVDRFDDLLVVQITTAGMERQQADVIAVLAKVLRPAGILLRNDTPVRALEGLDNYVETVLGTVPKTISVLENAVRFVAPLVEGQKTGWYFDQRLNRRRMREYVSDKRVLDVFSFVGAWGIQAAVAGAREVWCVDSSPRAIDQVHENARANGVAGRIKTIQGDAFETLKALRAEDQRFEVVILDPPAFIRRRKDLRQGTLAYQRLNQLAMQVLAREGILISASCSYHLTRDSLRQVMLQAARHLGRDLQILEQGHQGPDHPVHPAIPETDYLKAYFGRLTLT